MDIQIVKADTNELRDIAFDIRYKAYISKNCLAPNPEKRCRDKYDLLSNSTIFLALLNENPIGTIRTVVRYPDNQTSLPIEEVFFEDIKYLIENRMILVESCKYCILPEHQKDGLRISMPLFKAINKTASDTGADYILTAVRKKHTNFYKKMLSFEQLSDKEIKYPGLEYYAEVLIHDCKKVREQRRKEDPETFKYFYE